MKIKRLFPHPLLSPVLLVVWLLLNNTIAMGQVVMGSVLAIWIPWFTSSYWPEKIIIRKPWIFIKYIIIVLVEVIVANIGVAKLILGDSKKLNPGFINYPLRIKSPIAIGLLGNTVSMTPGTVTCDLSHDRRYLLIHVLHIDDAEDIKDEIYHNFERLLQEMFPS